MRCRKVLFLSFSFLLWSHCRCCCHCCFLQLAAKEAYLQAKAEIADEDRRRILAEFRTLIQEAATTAAEAATEKVADKAVAAAAAAAEAAEALAESAGLNSSADGGPSDKLEAEAPEAAVAASSNGHK